MADGTVLVTGAHGFLGRHVARALAGRGLRVRGLGHGTWNPGEWRSWGLSDWHACDVTLEALATHGGEPQAIVHCAGSASVGFSVAEPYLDFQRTVATTSCVLEFTRTLAPTARVVFLSSGGVYGSVAAPASEDRPLEPRSPYAVHKRIGEQLCAEYGRRYAVSSVILRLFSIYGPGLRKQLLWDACNRLTEGDAAFAGTGRERRDFVHVADAVELVALALPRASPEAPVVNGGTGHSASVAEVVEAVAAALPGAARPAFTGTERPGDPEQMLADPARARAWGWSPRWGWDDGVREYCTWFHSGIP
jgi:UDP-glucose 4-epimerase